MNDLILLRENGILKTLILDRKVETSKGPISLFVVAKDIVTKEIINSTSVFVEDKNNG